MCIFYNVFQFVTVVMLWTFPTQGITNTVGAVPGIVGVALTGYLLDSTHSWSVSYHHPRFDFLLAIISPEILYYFAFLLCSCHCLHHQSSSIWVVQSCGWHSPAVSLKAFLQEIELFCASHWLCWTRIPTGGKWFSHITNFLSSAMVGGASSAD